MKKFKKKLISIECQEDDPFANSIYTQIEADGVKFLKEDIKVSKDGLLKHDPNRMSPRHCTTMTIEDIEIGEQLGKGASGLVYAGIYKPTMERIAIKTINVYDREKRHQLMNDIKILLQNTIKAEKEDYQYCKFLVKLLGAFYVEGGGSRVSVPVVPVYTRSHQDRLIQKYKHQLMIYQNGMIHNQKINLIDNLKGSVKVILELMDAGSLGDILRFYKQNPNFPKPNEKILARISQQILNGLMYLHVVGNQIHRDIKPDNILINKKGEVKLTDFGIGKELGQSFEFCNTFVGTVTYMSPERIQGQRYNIFSDIWSFGLVIMELANGVYPYPPNKSYIEMLQIVRDNPSPVLGNNFSNEFQDFLSKCLEKNVNNRASAIELLRQPWILKNTQDGVNIAKWLQEINNEKIKNLPKQLELKNLIIEQNKLKLEELNILSAIQI